MVFNLLNLIIISLLPRVFFQSLLGSVPGTVLLSQSSIFFQAAVGPKLFSANETKTASCVSIKVLKSFTRAGTGP